MGVKETVMLTKSTHPPLNFPYSLEAGLEHVLSPGQ